MSQQIPPSLPEQRSTADPAEAELPSHARLEEELHALRRPGLAGLRRLRPEALAQVARGTGHTSDGTDEAAGIEALLEAAARRLAATPGPPGESVPPDGAADDRRGDPLGRAAAHTFGLFPGRRGAPAPERRKAAAAVYGVTSERFRRGQEQEVIAELAGSVLALARAATAAPARIEAPDELPDPPSRAAGPALPPATLSRITVHFSSVELLRDIDILVSSENTHMEMSKTFRPTVSGALRRAAAIRDTGGGITDDVLARELADWMRSHRRTGLPVRPGTVVPTSPGALAGRGCAASTTRPSPCPTRTAAVTTSPPRRWPRPSRPSSPWRTRNGTGTTHPWRPSASPCSDPAGAAFLPSRPPAGCAGPFRRS